MVESMTSKKSNTTPAVMLAVAVMLAAFSFMTGTSGAQTCGADIVVAGDQLVSWSTTNTVSTNIPVGQYSVTAISNDPTHAPGVAPDQLNEQYSFSTDTGLASGVTPDVPEDVTSISTGMGIFDVTTPISSITFTHHGDGVSANSVYPVLVFSCIEPEPAPTTTEAPATTEPPATTEAPAPTEAPTTTAAPLVNPPTSAPVTEAPAPTPAPTTPPSGSGQVSNGGNSGSATLPRTGTNANLALVAAGLIGAGASVVALSRKMTLEVADIEA